MYYIKLFLSPGVTSYTDKTVRTRKCTHCRWYDARRITSWATETKMPAITHDNYRF